MSGQEILTPVLSKRLIISLGAKEANSEGFEISNANWPAPGCHGGDTAFD